jgi:hypothetical protein
MKYVHSQEFGNLSIDLLDIDYDLCARPLPFNADLMLKTLDEQIVGYSAESELYRMDEFIRNVVSSEELAFNISMNKDGSKELVNLPLSIYFYRFLPAWIYSRNIVEKRSFFSKLFYAVYDELKLQDALCEFLPLDQIESETVAGIFNRLILLIRLKSPEVKRNNEVRQTAAETKFKPYDNFMQLLAHSHQKIDVLCFEMGVPQFSSLYQNTEPRIFHSLAQQNLEDLLTGIRTYPKFNGIVRYIWRLNHSYQLGFYYSIVLFIDSSQRLNYQVLASELTEFWNRQITKGAGYCNVFGFYSLDIPKPPVRTTPEQHARCKDFRDMLLLFVDLGDYPKFKAIPKGQWIGRGTIRLKPIRLALKRIAAPTVPSLPFAPALPTAPALGIAINKSDDYDDYDDYDNYDGPICEFE